MMATEKRERQPGLIRPACSHEAPTKGNMGTTPPPLTGWILTCNEDFDAAVRLNLLKYADCLTTLRLETELIEARAEIQQQASDIEDMKLSRRTAFVRCSCGRMRELNVSCRGCGV